MKKKIDLSHIDHNNAKRMEYFLNAVKYELKEIPFEWKQLKYASHMSAAVQYVSVSSIPITITVYFCDSYSDANEIAIANGLPYTPKSKWSLNGNLMYLVESEDESKVSEILGLFAGEE